jgi:hypothetical protein
MHRDGVCRVNERLYTKTVEFQDINYQLAQNEDKTQIFENYCDFLNYFDSSISVQLTLSTAEPTSGSFNSPSTSPTVTMI